MNKKQHQDSYFSRLQKMLPSGAQIIGARGAFRNGQESTKLTYKVDGQKFTTTFSSGRAVV